jgi:hypothetical protein
MFENKLTLNKLSKYLVNKIRDEIIFSDYVDF